MEEWEKLLDKWKIKREDVEKLLDEKIINLKNKKSIREKRVLGPSVKVDAGRFVALRDTNYPLKRFVLQEMNNGKYVRIGYYVLSLKKLRDEGKLRVVWGQYNPSFPKEDLTKLINKAKENGIIQ